ncbi:MAG: GNAT family N-acetyltransferase [Lachnospiraceae bacterium]|nr:GNAT family N-acetyltransferase [Lachnospiraceae bacterium]
MNTIGTKTIETERLILRRFRVEDAEDMFKNWTSDPEVTKFLSWPTHTSVETTRELVTDWVSRYEEGKTHNWGITLKGEDHVFGNIAVVSRDERTCSYEIGYCLGKAYWGQGIMAEALKAVIDYLFEGEDDLQRVYAAHDLRNPKSGRVMQKAGMHYDGMLRGSKRNRHGNHDTAYYSVLRSDRITEEHYEKLFGEIYPDFFEREYIRNIPEDEIVSEQILRLQEFDPNCYEKYFPENVTFGFYDGDLEELRKDVATVVGHWPQYFTEDSRIYCGYVDGKVASFCLIEDFGEHDVNGVKCRVAGPGCVGTLPEFRNRGIGLSMIRNVTSMLRDEFYDYSLIHYTYEPQWYGILGYKTILRWNGKGFVKGGFDGSNYPAD